MGEMWGRLKWDDDDLTPGKSKDGGLHNNLFDSDGKLKGAARFIQDDEREHVQDDEPITSPGAAQELPSAASEIREVAQGGVASFVAGLAQGAATGLAEVATPYAISLWEEKARPALEAKRDEVAHDAKRAWDEKAQPIINRQVARQLDKLAARKAKKVSAEQPIVVDGEVVPNETRRN